MASIWAVCLIASVCIPPLSVVLIPLAILGSLVVSGVQRR